MTLFSISNLSCDTVANPPTTLLHDVSFEVGEGEVVGLIGESGSGKTMASLAVLGLLPGGVEATNGTIEMAGERFAATASGRQGLAAIFQNPRAALNPTMRVGKQIVRVLRAHADLSKADAKDMAIDLLRRCGVAGADNVVRLYPHELSGGMCQRVMIAMAIAARPRILIADEPTTALDLTIQAQIIDLLRDVISETGCGVLLITHDLGVVAELCDRVVVLLGGRVMEQGSVYELFADPLHPYTQYLMNPTAFADPIGGVTPTADGCPFIARCPYSTAPCAGPQRIREVNGRKVACELFDGSAT
ncbi:MAG: ABC transporter ATP-binding protein [Ilumatobacteraceae bacterium]